MDIAVPLTRPDLLTQGVPPRQVDAAMRRGELVAVHRGILVARPAAGDFAIRARSALRTQRDDAVLFGRSAAVALGLPTVPDRWASMSEPIHVAVGRDDTTRSRRRGIERHLRHIHADDRAVIGGLPVTTVTRTLCDLAGSEPRQLGLSLMDAALRDARCAPAQLHAMVSRFRGLRGARRIRELVTLAREGVDSPGETRARLAVIDAGLPMPDVRLELWDGTLLLARGDLGYWRWLIWIEYDGYDIHTGRRVFRSDRHRDRWLARRGWEAMRLSDEDIAYPERFISHLSAAIAEAPQRIAAMPASRSPEVAAARVALGIESLPTS